METSHEEREVLKSLLNLVLAHPEDWEERVDRALEALSGIADNVGEDLQPTLH